MTRTPARIRARGQAVVELVLGTLLIVTILIFAIHFTETGYLSVKVTEAAHSAMLDATGYQLHDWPGDTSPAAAAAIQAGMYATVRYADFDSRKNLLNGGNVTLTFTQATAMNVQCQIGGGPGFGPSFITSQSYDDNGGMTCNASADITAFRFPTAFLEDANGGFFKEQHYTNTPMHVCGIGRANGTSCPSSLTTMLDDWGLTGAAEGRPCLLIPDFPGPCTNTAFWQLAFNVHMLTGFGLGFSGSTLAQQTVGMLPFPFFFGAENAFWLSAAGEETAFLQPLSLSFAEGLPVWPTTPGLVPSGLGGIPYTIAYAQRDGCFLGRNCPP